VRYARSCAAFSRASHSATWVEHGAFSFLLFLRGRGSGFHKPTDLLVQDAQRILQRLELPPSCVAIATSAPQFRLRLLQAALLLGFLL
jgi:hypothetical protein